MTQRRIQEEVLDEMNQLYSTYMRTDVHSERHSDVKSVRVNAI